MMRRPQGHCGVGAQNDLIRICWQSCGLGGRDTVASSCAAILPFAGFRPHPVRARQPDAAPEPLAIHAGGGFLIPRSAVYLKR
jgi:hypothetical protein